MCAHKVVAKSVADAVEALQDPQLESLILSAPSLGAACSRQVVEALQSNGTLTSLKVRQPPRLEALAQLLPSVAEHPALTTFALEDMTEVDGQAAAKLLAGLLVRSHSLTDLAITNNDFGLRGIDWLARVLESNDTVQSLRLINCGIGDPEALLLARALCRNRGLTHLCLEMNRICDDGVQAFMEALKVNGTLRSLNLCGNWISAEGARCCIEALEVNHSLTALDLPMLLVASPILATVKSYLAKNMEPPLVLTLRVRHLHEQQLELSFAKLSGNLATDRGEQVVVPATNELPIMVLKRIVKERLDPGTCRVDVVLPTGRLLRHTSNELTFGEALVEAW